jgi:meiosis induction protein kinase IME2/SME1
MNGHHELDYASWQQAGPSRKYHDGRIGVEEPMAERSYTEIKCLGDGSFGTVWLCDWHSPVQPETLLSAMQCGAGARAEWAGKRLVALKKMKRVWENGWNQAMTLGELKVRSLSNVADVSR